MRVCRKIRLVTRQGLMLCRDVRCMRPGGGGRVRNDAARDAFRGPEIKLLEAMRDLVVSPAMGVSTLEPGVVWTRE